MLQKSRISNAIMQSDEWRQARLGKFTSSRINELCGEKGLGEAGMNYIRTRAFEAISGVSSEQEFQSQATVDGLVNEPIACRKFTEKMGIEFMVTQKLIYDVDPHFASTPDGLVIKNKMLNELEYEVAVVEVKCYGAAHHMEMSECLSPQSIKERDKKLYWQVLDQLLVVDALIGYAVFFHPDLPIDKKGLHIVEFRKMQPNAWSIPDPARSRFGEDAYGSYPIKTDIEFLKKRKKEALELFNKMIN